MALRARLTKRNVLLGLMILSLAAAVFGQRLTARLRQAVQVFLAPLGDGGMYVVSSLRSGGPEPSASLSTAEVARMLEENQRLREQLAEMDRRLAEEFRSSRAALEQVQSIRSSFFPQEDLPLELIPARVVGADALPYGRGRVLNAGAAQGAREGAAVLSRLLMTDRSKEIPPRLAVITASALVGRLAASGAFTCQLQLVTDRGFELRGRILRLIDPNHPRQIQVMQRGAAAAVTLSPATNRPVPVLAKGDGAGGLTVEAVSAYENILTGDWLLTVDDDPYLRTEIRVGVVTEVQPHPKDLRFVCLKIRPFEDLEALREVYIVYWKPP